MQNPRRATRRKSNLVRALSEPPPPPPDAGGPVPPVPRKYASIAFSAALLLIASVVAMHVGVRLDLAGSIASVSAVGTLVAATLLVQKERRRSAQLAQSAAALREQVRGVLERDWSTGLITGNEFWRVLRREINRSKRYGRECSIVVADVDMDAFLDSSPHAENADPAHLARHLVDLVHASLRESDTVARRTGVFGVKILLPETPAEGARVVASRIQQRLRENPIDLLDGKSVPLTVRTVVVSYPADGESAAGLAAILGRMTVVRDGVSSIGA